MTHVIVKSKSVPTKPTTQKPRTKSKRDQAKLVQVRYDASALGILLKRKVITAPMYKAAHEFTKLRQFVFGSPFSKTPNLYQDKVDQSYREHGLNAPTDLDEELEKEYHYLINYLKENDRLGTEELVNLVIYDRLPSWLIRPHHRSSDLRRRQGLIQSFNLLVNYFAKK